jgi:pimeloyl-ACP methyl ester carboxylesterase
VTGGAGVRLSSARRGQGPEVVFLHGLALDGRMWSDVVDDLVAAGYSTCVTDLRGHGRSPVIDEDVTLEALTDDVAPLIGEGAHVIGFSMGGMIAMRLAARGLPIASLTLVSTSAEAEPADRRARYEQMAEALVDSPVAVDTADAFLSMQFHAGWAEAHPDVRDRYRALFLENDRRGVYRASLAVVRRPTILDRLASVRAPTLVIAGTADHSIPAAQGRRIAAEVPGARFKAIDDAAHLVHEESRERFCQLLRSHLRERT